MRLRLSSLFILLTGLNAGLIPAQQTPDKPVATATLTFHFERPGLPVPEYTLALHPDGTGTYRAQYAPAPPQPSRYGGVEPSVAAAPESVDMPVLLSPATTAKLFERARTVGYFEHPCESKAKNIANTGKKVLSYAGPDGTGTCTFNYTENKLISAVTDTFLGIAYTLEEGHTLAASHRFDHLGLDSEMIQFTEAVKDGRALEVGAIAAVLRSIAEDAQLLDRVRARATQLLAANSAPAPSQEGS